jgi:hypothetical protein
MFEVDTICAMRAIRRLSYLLPLLQPAEENHISDKQDKQRSEADTELEREIRKGRKFTLREAIARMVGPGSPSLRVRG